MARREKVRPGSGKAYLTATFLAVLAAGLLASSAASAYQVDLWTYTRYQYQNDDRGTSHRLVNYNDLSLTGLMEGRLAFKLSGWFQLTDFSGDRYWSTDDDYVRISQAYLHYTDPGHPLWFKLGRHYLDRVDTISVDGATVGWDIDKRWQLMAFAGAPVSFYSSTSKDFLGGAAVVYKPWRRTTLQADAYGYFGHGQDKDSYLATALRLTQFIPVLNTRAYARLRGLDSEVRDFYTHLSAFAPEINTSIAVTYFYQPETRGLGQEAFSPFYSAFGQVFGGAYPYHRGGINLQTFVGEHVTLLAGAAAKRMLDEPPLKYQWANVDSDVFNAGLLFNDLLLKGFSLSFLGNFVDNKVGTKRDRFFDITGEAEYRFHKTFKAALGLTYTGYRFSDIQYPDTWNDQASVYNLDDRIGSRVYYLDLDWRPAPDHRLLARAAYEAVDQRYADAWAFELGYQVRFSWSGK